MSLAPLDRRVLAAAQGWLQQGHSIWLCTVLHTWGSAPRAPGSLLAASDDGRVCGSLSGGCIEEHFLQRLAAGEYRQPSQCVRYGAGGVEAKISLPCGGSLEILIEFMSPSTAAEVAIGHLRQALDGELRLEKKVTFGQPARLSPAHQEVLRPQVTRLPDGVVLRFGAAPQILLAGLSPVAEYVIPLARLQGMPLQLCEHREALLATFLADAGLSSGVEIITRFPARHLEQHGCPPHTAILCLTHDARIDDLTLMEACRSTAFYVGALGSARNSARRHQRLLASGDLTAAQLARISAPVGLAIGSRTPAEIALAIVADIVRVKNGV